MPASFSFLSTCGPTPESLVRSSGAPRGAERSSKVSAGASAISSVRQGYVQNITATGAYGRAVEAGLLPVARGYRLDAEDRLRRAVIERLMCDLEVELCELATAYGRPCHHFAAELERCRPFATEGLVRIEGTRLVVLEAGRPALRVIAAQFDSHLAAGETPRHAVAV